MDYGSILSLVPVAAAIASFIFAVVKFYVDYDSFSDKWAKKSKNKTFILVFLSVICISLVISSLLLAHKQVELQKDDNIAHPRKNNTSISTNVPNSQEKIPPNIIKDDSRNINDDGACIIDNNNIDFYEKTDNCVSNLSCLASIHLCTGIAQARGRNVVKDITCPIDLGRTLPLDKRRDISDRLLLRRCYPESYSWLARLPGPEADNARGAWRAKVCPEAPNVFSDPRFAELGPITDGPCTR